jgi:transcriptional regulator with GAF, ATPase, and Fis domain
MPLIKVNCAAIPETLLESELFGHVRGAFTGATTNKKGKFALADGGTIFLDEIGTLTTALQAKLLRVLQEREFEPLGAERTQKVDVRVIAATNRDLRAMVGDGRFQEDLYYRLSVIPIELPPLRERRDDVAALVDHFVRKHMARTGKHIERVDKSALDALQAYEWPGNVRELRNCLERAIILAGDAPIEEKHLRLGPDPTYVPGARDESLEEAKERAGAMAERNWLLRALEKAKGDRTVAAQAAGLTPRRLEAKLREHGLDEN